MKAVLRQQRGQVVARNAPGDIRKAAADRIGVPLLKGFQPPIDFRARPTLADDPLIVLAACCAETHSHAAIGHDVERVDMVGGRRPWSVELGQHRMHAARVVADHAAEGAPAVCPRIWTKRPPVCVRGIFQIVEDETWLYARLARRAIDLEHAIETLGRIDDDGGVAALAGDARARSARKDGRTMPVTDGDGIDDVVDRARDDDADRHLAVVRRVGGVERAIAGAEPHLGVRRGAEVGLQGPAKAGHYRLVVSAFRRTRGVHRTSNGVASARLNSRPRPGRDKSG